MENGEVLKDILYFGSKNNKKDLDFRGRVTKPSKKNFQLTDPFDESKVYMQFGRAGPQTFNLDVAHPFSVYQAFAICLSAFDTKYT
mmetsp:Transcript_33536/g.51555  ORF Transcript_33536/g.51555 Transcript_33536/m.51555 type:complete len:86 (-) Transcript_33536:100-357(-)